MVGFLAFTTGLLLGFIVSCIICNMVYVDRIDELTTQMDVNNFALETIERHFNKDKEL